jgi:hypothetical protein
MNTPDSARPLACPRCGAPFECRPDDIAHCQCSAVVLTREDRAHIAAQGFGDCLCAACLRELARERDASQA